MSGRVQGLDVHGRDVDAAAYRVSTRIGARRIKALVPEFLMETGWRPGARPSHQDAYEWIARNRPKIKTAIAAMAAGRVPPRPYDALQLVEED
ncbi:MAG: hypothetical protein AAF667_09320 [Pseudomonadota bacterium]